MHYGNVKLFYNSNPEQLFRQDQFDLLTMKVEGVGRNPGSLRQELANNAKEIVRQRPNIHLALSGGWESQVALRAFIDAGIKPKVLIVKFPNGLNDNDVIPALAACKEFDIEPRVVPGAVDQFIERAFKDTVKKYQCYSLMPAFFARIAELANIDILVVDKIELKRDVNPNRAWNFVRSEDYSMFGDRFNSLEQRTILTSFFTYSAESMLSFLTLPTVTTVVSNHASGKISLASLKQKIYREAGYDMPIYYRTISTDNIQGLNNTATEIMENTLTYKQRFAYVDYNSLILALTNQGKKEWQYL
jgi:hypothetical protein